MNNKLAKFCWLLCVGVGFVWGQNKLNLAVLPFTGDQTVTAEQLTFISSKFTSEMIAKASYTVLDRSKMDYILQEQSFQQTGICNTSECQVQIGQLLGVDRIVAGNLVRFGTEYALHIDFINVGSGQIEHSVEVVQEGDLQQVYKLICSAAASQLDILVKGGASADSLRTVQKAQLEAATARMNARNDGLSTKRIIALSLLGGALGGAGVGIVFNQMGVAKTEDYADAEKIGDYDAALEAYNGAQDAQTIRNAGYGVSIGSAVLAAILWFWPEGGK